MSNSRGYSVGSASSSRDGRGGRGGRRGGHTRNNILHIGGGVFDFFMVVLSLVVMAVLMASYLAPYVNPKQWALFSILGLVAPIIYVFNFVLLLYWVLRWKRFVFVPLVALVVGFGNVSLFYRPFVSKQYSTESSKRQFRLITYNVRGFIDKKGDEFVSTLDSDARFIAGLDPDVLCMQEFQTTRKAPRSMFDDCVPKLKQSVHNFRLKSSSGGWGLAIYSRYPILKSGAIEFDNSTNSAMWADIKLSREDTIRLFNCHLQTTSIDTYDRSYIENQEFLQAASEQIEEKVKSIFGKLQNSYTIRAQQADTIAMLIAASPYPVIVCGDFNDTPLSYAYHTIRGDLSDAFVEKGRGLSTTYVGLFKMFRIDYVLHSSRFRAVSYETPQQSPSDHNPVCVTFVPES